MQRRDFLSSAAALGLSLAASSATDALAQNAQAKVSTQGNKLIPPEKELIPVAVAISQNTTWIDFVGPQAVFETWHFDPVLKRPAPKFKIFMVGEKLEPVDSLIPDYTFETAPPARIVIVPAQTGSPALLDWLRKVSEKTDVTMSVCVGARHLAKAGLLNGKTATTHHESIDRFAKDFPEVKWVRGVRFVEGAKISTGGGLTAGIDLALRVVERYFGRPAAQQVADHLEYQSKGWII
jgi:transcriptional regulator GlxA family with amidase domain